MSESGGTPQRPSTEDLPAERSLPATTRPRPDGITLRRLLAVATLTPRQTALLVSDLVAGVKRRHATAGEQGGLSDRVALVDTSGRLQLIAGNGVDWPGGTPVGEVTALLRRLAEASGRGRSPRASHLDPLLRAVDSGDADLTGLLTRVMQVVAPVLDPADTAAVARVRQELAALVTATSGQNRPAAPEGGEPGAAVSGVRVLAPEGWRPPRRKAWHRARIIRPRKALVLGLVATVVLATGLWVAPKAWSELQRGWHAVFTPEQPPRQLDPVSPPPEQTPDATPAVAEPDNDPADVERPAPRRAGPISRIVIERAEGGCSPGEICPIRVDVHIDPSAQQRVINWSLHVVDRCTGDEVTADGAAVTAQPWWRQVYGISRPTLPRGSALAVHAVTDSPARASSPALLVPADAAKC